MERVLIIGGASLDTIHFGEKSAKAAGGAGTYTAAAAHLAGVRVTMFAPIPDPVPDVLRPLTERVEWIGPLIHPEELPHFEIRHHGNGQTTMERAVFGRELFWDSGSLPEDLTAYRLVHLTPIDPVERQLEFMEVCRNRGASRISAGTYPCKAEEDLAAVRELYQKADLFFMNAMEAKQLFGNLEAAGTKPGGLLFVTQGERGAWVFQGKDRTFLPPLKVDVQDPTGAGDTFCGSTLAGLANGMHPLMAAREGMKLAAHVITKFGPTALWGSFPEGKIDNDVVVDDEQVDRISERIKALPDVVHFDFVGPEYPPVGHPKAVDYFFVSSLQQFGFWEEAQGRYQAPMIAIIDGHASKGSDYLWRACRRKLSDEERFFEPKTQAQLTRDTMMQLFQADDGSNPMPGLDLHLAQAQAYGTDMLALQVVPEDIVQRANATPAPLRAFLEGMDHIGGYKEDPLRKKSALLAMILSQRPERFLEIGENESIPPIIDYHLMRSCLRTGLLDVLDDALRDKLQERRILQPHEEWAVRHAAFEAMECVVQKSGRDMGAVDWFFFNARHRCPEMTDPQCELCPVDPVCAHRVELFQPVIRTTYY